MTELNNNEERTEDEANLRDYKASLNRGGQSLYEQVRKTLQREKAGGPDTSIISFTGTNSIYVNAGVEPKWGWVSIPQIFHHFEGILVRLEDEIYTTELAVAHAEDREDKHSAQSENTGLKLLYIYVKELGLAAKAFDRHSGPSRNRRVLVPLAIHFLNVVRKQERENYDSVAIDREE